MGETNLLATLNAPFKRARLTNATDTSFPIRIPTTTKPTTKDANDAASQVAIETKRANGIVVVPYILGDDNDQMAMRVIGWRPAGFGSAQLWVPVILAELTCTASAVTGVANAEVINTERFCDTLALVSGNDDISIDIVSPTGDVVAHAVLDVKGFELIEFTFDMTVGDPTSGNCLYSFV